MHPGVPAGTSGNATGSTSDDTALSTAQQSQRNNASNALAGGNGASNGAAVSSSTETMVPLGVVAKLVPSTTPLEVSHDGGSVAATLSFNVAPGHALSPGPRL